MTRFILLCLRCLFTVNPAFAQLEPLEKVPESAQKVQVGLYMMNVHDLDMAANSFYADFYLWARWKGELNPFDGMEFVNEVEDWGTTRQDLVDSVVIDKEGYKYFIQRVEGRFFHAFDLENYPLDEQRVDIQLENSWYTIERLAMLPDTVGSKLKSELVLPGWDIKGFEMIINKNSYNTNFGDIAEDPSSRYSNLTFNMVIERPSNYFLWKLLLPLLVVIVSSIGAFFLHPSYIDARICLPVSALLTAVFLQQTYTDNLPDIGYMVLMDQIYVMSYILIIVAIIETIIMANWVSTEEDEDVERVRRVDKIFSVCQVLAFFLGVILLVIL